MNDQRGFILPVLLGILFILCGMLLAYASHIEVKFHSYKKIDAYMEAKLNDLEKNFERKIE